MKRAAEQFFVQAADFLRRALPELGVSSFWIGLAADGVVGGVGSVPCLLPACCLDLLSSPIGGMWISGAGSFFDGLFPAEDRIDGQILYSAFDGIWLYNIGCYGGAHAGQRPGPTHDHPFDTLSVVQRAAANLCVADRRILSIACRVRRWRCSICLGSRQPALWVSGCAQVPTGHTARHI